LDQLLDCAEWHYHHHHHHQQQQQHADATNTLPPLRVVDIGSGCGRLCLYMALTRQQYQHVAGIEIAHLLHQEAAQAVHRAQEGGWMRIVPTSPASILMDREGYTPSTRTVGTFVSASNALSLLHGPAEDFSDTVLKQADLIFCYSTTWETAGFSPLTQTLVLSEYWNQLLTNSCRPGCVVITTDRSLDTTWVGASSRAGSGSGSSWVLLDQVEVGNPEVGGSIGYVQMRV
jgi:tRNA G46 methylase TrmB